MTVRTRLRVQVRGRGAMLTSVRICLMLYKWGLVAGEILVRLMWGSIIRPRELRRGMTSIRPHLSITTSSDVRVFIAALVRIGVHCAMIRWATTKRGRVRIVVGHSRYSEEELQGRFTNDDLLYWAQIQRGRRGFPITFAQGTAGTGFYRDQTQTASPGRTMTAKGRVLAQMPCGCSLL
jgi:hypothetical protein